MNQIEENLKHIRRRIADAAQKAGRDPADITLVGVTKTIEIGRIQSMAEAGVVHLGENKVQEILDKYPHLSGVNWHMIGHLQTNKVKYIADKVCMIHSVDSLRLGEEIGKRMETVGRCMDILIEVNIAGEDSKFGVAPESVMALARELQKLPSVSVAGLMCVAPFVENPEQNRVYFKQMKQLFIDMQAKMDNNSNIRHLSMGMTNDYDIAIEEGATIVRIGTGIFGERYYG